MLRIAELAKSLGVSPDSFEKRFRRIVGASPKKYSRIVRFTSLINRGVPHQSLTDMAYETGYFDQAFKVQGSEPRQIHVSFRPSRHPRT